MSRLREEQKAPMSRLREEQKAPMSRLREEQKAPMSARINFYRAHERAAFGTEVTRVVEFIRAGVCHV